MKRPYEMTEDEFVEEHRTQFIRTKGKRVIEGVLSTDGASIYPLPKESQKNGKLLQSPDDILRNIYQSIASIRPQSFFDQLQTDLAFYA